MMVPTDKDMSADLHFQLKQALKRKHSKKKKKKKIERKKKKKN